VNEHDDPTGSRGGWHGGAARLARRAQWRLWGWQLQPQARVLVMATKVAADWGGCQGDDDMEALAIGFGMQRGRELAQWPHGRKEVVEDVLTTEEVIGGTRLTGMMARSTVTDGSYALARLGVLDSVGSTRGDDGVGLGEAPLSKEEAIARRCSTSMAHDSRL
jgi:hypothetical protein